MRSIFPLVSTVFVLALAACGAPDPDVPEEEATVDTQAHVGEWQGMIRGQGDVELDLYEEGRFSMNMVDADRTVAGHYEIDYDADPVELDLEGDGRVIEMIVEFTDPGTMRLKGTANPRVGRPSDFSDEPNMMMMELRRVE